MAAKFRGISVFGAAFRRTLALLAAVVEPADTSALGSRHKTKIAFAQKSPRTLIRGGLLASPVPVRSPGSLDCNSRLEPWIGQILTRRKRSVRSPVQSSDA